MSDNFADEFLKHYLKNGMGSMSKGDTDALVMHLLDKYSHKNGVALKSYPNQAVSEALRASLAKIKRLRYEAGLKYGGRVEDEARGRFVACLSKAILESDHKKIVVVIEDTLARNWIQGQIKEHGVVSDGSFNSEIVKVRVEEFFSVLRALFGATEVEDFKSKYDELKSKKTGAAVVSGFASLLKSFAKGAVAKAGSAAAVKLSPFALPLIGG